MAGVLGEAEVPGVQMMDEITPLPSINRPGNWLNLRFYPLIYPISLQRGYFL